MADGMRFAGRIFTDAGAAIPDATVNLYDVGTTTPVRSTTTTSATGDWEIDYATRGLFDIEIVNGTTTRRIVQDTEVQFKSAWLWNADANEYALGITRTEDASEVEVAYFEGDRATMADNDAAYISLRLSDNGGNQDDQARIRWAATTVAAGATQDGDLILQALVNNTMTTMVTLDGSANEVLISTLTLTNDLGLAHGGTGASLTDPGADRIMFWDDSETAVAFLTVGNGLTITATTITSGLARAGGNTTEATATVTVAADLLTVSSLSIGAATPFMIIGCARKSTGSANDAAMGLKLNTTTVGEAATGGSVMWLSSTTNQAEDGPMVAFIGARVANYLSAGVSFQGAYISAGGTAAGPATTPVLRTAPIPNATITDVVIRGISDDSGITHGADEVHVYSYSTS